MRGVNTAPIVRMFAAGSLLLNSKFQIRNSSSDR
jgi:hypothetical protein